MRLRFAYPSLLFAFLVQPTVAFLWGGYLSSKGPCPMGFEPPSLAVDRAQLIPLLENSEGPLLASASVSPASSSADPAPQGLSPATSASPKAPNPLSQLAEAGSTEFLKPDSPSGSPAHSKKLLTRALGPSTSMSLLDQVVLYFEQEAAGALAPPASGFKPTFLLPYAPAEIWNTQPSPNVPSRANYQQLSR